MVNYSFGFKSVNQGTVFLIWMTPKYQCEWGNLKDTLYQLTNACQNSKYNFKKSALEHHVYENTQRFYVDAQIWYKIAKRCIDTI